MDESDEQWIRSLLATGAGAITAAPVSRDEVVAVGRARLARRRVLAGAVLTVVAGLALTGYTVAAPDAGSRPGNPAVTASATSATGETSATARPGCTCVESTGPTPGPAAS